MFLLGKRIRNVSRPQKNENGRRDSMTITKRRPRRFPIKRQTTPGPSFGRRRPFPPQKRSSNKLRSIWRHEAWRIAVNIAKLPEILCKGDSLQFCGQPSYGCMASASFAPSLSRRPVNWTTAKVLWQLARARRTSGIRLFALLFTRQSVTIVPEEAIWAVRIVPGVVPHPISAIGRIGLVRPISVSISAISVSVRLVGPVSVAIMGR